MAQHLLIDPVRHLDIYTGRIIMAATLAVEEPQEHLELIAVGRAINWNEVVRPPDLINITNHRLCSERQFLSALSFDVPPHMLAHGNGAARPGSIVVAKSGAERQVAVDERGHNLIDQFVRILWRHELASGKVSVEDHEVGLLIVEDRVHDTDALEVCIRFVGYRVRCESLAGNSRVLSNCSDLRSPKCRSEKTVIESFLFCPNWIPG
jgi:hypothetical protein